MLVHGGTYGIWGWMAFLLKLCVFLVQNEYGGCGYDVCLLVVNLVANMDTHA